MPCDDEDDNGVGSTMKSFEQLQHGNAGMKILFNYVNVILRPNDFNKPFHCQLGAEIKSC